PSSFASLRLCASHSLPPATVDTALFPIPIPQCHVLDEPAFNSIQVKSFLAQRRKGAKFFRINNHQGS
ncbi:MAG: hypothetical protein WCO57_13565, partial [Verrucomicrobiota bacterium]